ncbi:MAG: tetratricopeptide repeat protein [Actinomycetota bacterium]
MADPRRKRPRPNERVAPARRRAHDGPQDRSPSYAPVHLADDVVKELQSTARPGKGGILVQVFSETAAAFAAEDFRRAIELGEQAKHIALRAPSVRELLGLALYHTGSWKEAARELAAFRRLAGTTEQNPVMADCFRALHKPERALELCDEIDREAVAPAVAYEGEIVAAGALRDMGRIDAAIRRLERLELEPEQAQEYHLRAWYVLGDLLERRGRFTQARRWFEAISSLDPGLTDAPKRAERLRSR